MAPIRLHRRFRAENGLLYKVSTFGLVTGEQMEALLDELDEEDRKFIEEMASRIIMGVRLRSTQDKTQFGRKAALEVIGALMRAQML
jgi:hypothetical protein